ncbi:hypothetical protein NB636_05580 [Oxalobacter aliiformigenes]|uniref:hypothetical protein n=1 Tax=Oxalobacter aliiformigenes TaxID=2946593 RepID=UPI0022B01DFC|nr:hypothetical protein [Oxalobacter aliiformigenes]MCZ4065824.1 hypothetical protein [Oxalobacter aliiformigenes]WAW00317.1 hypothetical protein NB636_05580 [Oxalobacter aliiformigenes]
MRCSDRAIPAGMGWWIWHGHAVCRGEAFRQYPDCTAGTIGLTNKGNRSDVPKKLFPYAPCTGTPHRPGRRLHTAFPAFTRTRGFSGIIPDTPEKRTVIPDGYSWTARYGLSHRAFPDTQADCASTPATAAKPSDKADNDCRKPAN